MPFRFVHSADIHLDSPLRTLALKNPLLRDLIANATRAAFEGLVTLAIDESVDAVLLAGDLYDDEQTSMKTARFFAEQMRRLDAADIRVFILRGNHDALSKITKELSLPESVVVFGGHAKAIAVDRGGAPPDVVIHGISFRLPKAPESLLPNYKAPVVGAVNIGMMHTSLGGAQGHDDYAPCSVAELDGHGYDYWALGHIHKRSVNVNRATIVMPGNPQGRDINEAGAKSVSLVTVSDEGRIEVEERSVGIAQFERLDIDVAIAADWRELISTIGTAMRATRLEIVTEHLILRLHLRGQTPLAWQMRRDTDILRTEVELEASQIGNLWVEKIELDVTPAVVVAGTQTDIVGDLRNLIADEVLGNAGFQASLQTQAEDLLKYLPIDVRAHFGQTEGDQLRYLTQLAAEGTDDVLAKLQSSAVPGRQ